VSSKILTALFLVGGASALYAGPVYSCGGGSACDGNLYAAWVVTQTTTSYVLDVSIQVTSGYTGNASDFINALSIIPDNNSPFTGATLTGHPGGVWNGMSGGCGSQYVCAGATGMGASLFTYNNFTHSYSPSTLTWQFMIQGAPPSLGDTAHIKFNYISSLGTSVGGNGSFDVCIGVSGCGGVSADPPSSVPEPVTSALIGSGLVGLYFLRRRFPR